MILFYNPADSQVMALYKGETKSTVWSDAGYLKATVGDATLEKLLLLYGRDAVVTVVRGTVTGVTPNKNPIQPTLSADETEIASLLVKVGDATATISDIVRLMKLERGL